MTYNVKEASKKIQIVSSQYSLLYKFRTRPISET